MPFPAAFLGVVESVSPDGRTIELVAGGLGDAFDLYHVEVEDFTAETQEPLEDAGEPAGRTTAEPTCGMGT